MADGSIISTRERITRIVSAMLAKRRIETTPSAFDDLRGVGLTSLDMVNLMLAVEAAFDLEIPEAEMTPDNFRSIAAVEAVVARLSTR